MKIGTKIAAVLGSIIAVMGMIVDLRKGSYIGVLGIVAAGFIIWFFYRRFF